MIIRCLLILCVSAVAAHAQTAGSVPRMQRPGADTVVRSMQIHGAAWLMGLTGTIRPSASGPMATIDASSNPIMESDAANAYVSMLYRRNRFALVADLSGFSSSDAGVDSSGDDATISQRLSVLTVTPGYAMIDGENGSLALLGGVRIWRMSNAVRIVASDSSDAARTSYYDVVFGARAERRFGKHASASVLADAGGFGIASQLTVQAVGMLSVRVAEQWSLVATYRHLSVDYRGDSKRATLKMFGPTLGAAVHF